MKTFKNIFLKNKIVVQTLIVAGSLVAFNAVIADSGTPTQSESEMGGSVAAKPSGRLTKKELESLMNCYNWCRLNTTTVGAFNSCVAQCEASAGTASSARGSVE